MLLWTGYGNITPRTIPGKLGTIFYAMVGMPLFLLYVANVGDVLATSFRWAYVKLCKCNFASRRRRLRRSGAGVHHHHSRSSSSHAVTSPSSQNPSTAAAAAAAAGKQYALAHYADVLGKSAAAANNDYRMYGRETFELQSAAYQDLIRCEQNEDSSGGQVDYQTATVPFTISLSVMVSYICGGGALFMEWEKWNFLDGSYFCFISLSTTGFGDLGPGDSFDNSQSGLDLRLIFCSMYLIIGMALIAMCFNLMQEEVIAKVRKCGQVLGCIRSGDE